MTRSTRPGAVSSRACWLSHPSRIEGAQPSVLGVAGCQDRAGGLGPTFHVNRPPPGDVRSPGVTRPSCAGASVPRETSGRIVPLPRHRRSCRPPENSGAAGERESARPKPDRAGLAAKPHPPLSSRRGEVRRARCGCGRGAGPGTETFCDWLCSRRQMACRCERRPWSDSSTGAVAGRAGSTRSSPVAPSAARRCPPVSRETLVA